MPRSEFASFVAVFAILSIVAPVTADERGTHYAFLVGCAGYDRNQLRPLPSPINDVEGFKKALLGTGFDEEHIKVLHDRQPNRRYLSEKAKILKELQLLLEGIRPNDTLVVALSGHGVHFKGDKTGYFCPVDARLDDKRTLIPMEGPGSLFELIKSCKARRKLLIVNACRNDPGSDLGLAVNRVQIDDEDNEQVPEGIAAIYSCKAGQKSYYDDKRNLGIFFDHVIRSWQGEYHKGDSQLTLEAFFEQVIAKTKADVDRTLGESQVPVVRREYTGGAWVLGESKKEHPGEAAYRIGFKLDYGIGVKVDKLAAVEHYRRAANLNHPLALAELATYQNSGSGGLQRDPKEAVRLARLALGDLRKAADRNEAPAQYALAMLYERGIEVARDTKAAIAWYRKAAASNYGQAQVNLGGLLIDEAGGEEDDKEAVALYRKAAAQGLPDAYHCLGSVYENGHGVKKDDEEALKWYRKAADQNLPLAFSTLGSCYMNGYVVKRDEQEALKWYRKAADQMNLVGLNMIGVFHADGRGGLPVDHVESVRWFRKAAERGQPDAQGNLGNAYLHGHGVEKDNREAFRWIRSAADQGLPGAQNDLGWLYADGLGVDRDEKEAVAWFRKAAAQELPEAYNSLGAMYRDGRGVERDAKVAVGWFFKAADKDHGHGTYNLAHMYESGLGVERDVREALDLYRKAAGLGVEAAREAIKRLGGKF